MTISSSSSSSFSDPISNLVSFTAALYALILLYFPLSLSPVFLLTSILLLFLLRLGTLQKPEPNISKAAPGPPTRVDTWASDHLAPNPGFGETFVEWDVRAPLEVIYEAYDEEEEPVEEEGQDPTRNSALERNASLSRFYPETDSDSASSDGGFPVFGQGEWEEEDREGMLIEIALHGNRKEDSCSGLDSGLDFHGEEDNLIEIDISPVKNDDAFLDDA